jgi:hypothetical protein
LLRSVSNLDMLHEGSQQIGGIAPTAIIFHVSRCGSTLASQLLALNGANLVLSEVPFFDELLRWQRINGDDDSSAELLKTAIQIYTAERNNVEHVFIKTDSWHIFFYSIFRKLYPQTPFILLYRRPDEVIRSQQKRRGMHAVPGLIEAELFGFGNEVKEICNLDQYTANVLEKYFEAFIDILVRDPLAFPVNYNEGALEMYNKIAGVAGITTTAAEMDRIQQRAGFHAKYPDQVFAEEPIKAEIPGYCMPAYKLYLELEMTRNKVAKPEGHIDG